jgi:hypothetical protein
MSRSVAHNVVKEKTTIGRMAALSGIYEKPSANYKVHLMKKLFNMKMAEDTSIAQHLMNLIQSQINCLLWRLILIMRSAH